MHIVVPVFNRAAVTLDFETGVRRQGYGAIRLYEVDDSLPVARQISCEGNIAK